MPRIDPKQLLKTLGVLLSNDGGIKSKDEVARLAQLMQKFSKKLVSKCIYVHILKATEPSLLEEFLNENGWDLINQWFLDAIKNQNFALALEILGLFLVCPMTKELLKASPETNHAPRLINQLRKNQGTSDEMRDLVEKVYRKWVSILSPLSSNACALKDLGGRTNKIRINSRIRKVVTVPNDDSENQRPIPRLIIKVPPPKPTDSLEFHSNSEKKQFTSSLVDDDSRNMEEEPVETPSPIEEDEILKEENQTCSNELDDVKTGSDQMTGGSLSLLQSLAEEVSDNLKKKDNVEKEVPIKVNDVKQTSEVKQSNLAKENTVKVLEDVTLKKEDPLLQTKSSPVSKSEEKPKKIKRDRPHHPRDEVNDDQKLHIKAMAKKLKEEAQAKKDKETLKAISCEKMGRIPKIPKKSPPSSSNESADKKDSASVKKSAGSKSFSDLLVGLDSKPKTVKTPLNRNKTAALLEGLSTTKPSKTSSTSNSKSDSKSKLKDKKDSKVPPAPFNISSNPLKKDSSSSSSITKKEGLGKLVANGESKTSKKSDSDSPKVKKDVHNFHESSSFMDAIFSSMGQSDIPRKKKRRLSDKDESSSPKQPKSDSTDKKKVEEVKEAPSENETPTPAFSFYRDTLEDEPAKDEDTTKKEKESSIELANKENSPEDDTPVPKKSEDDLPFEEPSNPLPREVKGILVYHRGMEKRNKAISWKPETELTSIRYFELDETERVNVNKLKYDFTNMRKMEFELEKAALKSSKGSLEEEVVDKWYKPVPITVDNRSPFKPGGSSKEKTVQALREAEVLQAIYFSKENVPDTPSEPDSSEVLSDSSMPPLRIPLDDKEGIPEESVKDFSQSGWPLPKASDIDREPSFENSFSLPPSLSNFLSSIGNTSLQGLVPPNMAGLSQEEQNTLAAQAQAMQKLGMIPPGGGGPPQEVENQLCLPHPVQQRPPPPIHHPHMSEPPPPSTHHHFQQPPPTHNNGPPMPPHNNNNNNQGHQQFGPPTNNMQGGPMMNDFHPNNFNNHVQHRHPPPQHHHHPYGGRGFHNGGGPRGGGGRFNDRQNGGGGFRPKDHRDNRGDYRDRSRGDHQHMMGGRRVCKFFAQRGHCRDGERCRFLHDR